MRVLMLVVLLAACGDLGRDRRDPDPGEPSKLGEPCESDDECSENGWLICSKVRETWTIADTPYPIDHEHYRSERTCLPPCETAEIVGCALPPCPSPPARPSISRDAIWSHSGYSDGRIQWFCDGFEVNAVYNCENTQGIAQAYFNDEGPGTMRAWHDLRNPCNDFAHTPISAWPFSFYE